MGQKSGFAVRISASGTGAAGWGSALGCDVIPELGFLSWDSLLSAQEPPHSSVQRGALSAACSILFPGDF